MSDHKKKLRMDSITYDGIDPNSVLGKAILAGDQETISRITKAARKSRGDSAAMEKWFRRLRKTPPGGSLPHPVDENPRSY